MDSAQQQNSPPQREHRWFQEPWVQGIGTGLSALVPARSYPGWLRQTMMWVPAVGLGALVSSPAAWRRLAASAQAQPEPPDTSGADRPRRNTLTRWLGRAGGGVVVGALVYGNMRLGFWLDGAIERGLRRARVPAPRVVLALAAGGLAARTAMGEKKRR